MHLKILYETQSKYIYFKQVSQILEPFLNYFLIDNINYKIFIITLSFLFFIVFKNYLSKIYLNFILKLFRIDKSRLNQNTHNLINYQIKIFLLFIPFYIFFSIYDFYPYLNLILQNILKSFFIIIIRSTTLNLSS